MKQINTLALSALEEAINRYVSLDPEASEKRRPLEGKRLKLVIKPVTLFFFFEKDKIKLLSATDKTPHTTLEGYPLSFLKLQLTDKHHLFSIFKTEISISGDIELGQHVKTFFERIDIDWEEHLSRLTGDIIAHQLSTIAKRTQAFSKRLLHATQQNITDYLQEECRVLPCKEELTDFFDDIDGLRFRVDRLEARLKEQLS
jgi:ubiquinone biosynthesis protein UbiJ